MKNLNSPSSVASPHAASNYDELYMQQSITFSESLKVFALLQPSFFWIEYYDGVYILYLN